jgi:glutaredoxin
MLQLLTGRRTVPNVIVDFASLGGSDEITLLHGEGVLQKRLVNYHLIT